MAKLSKTMQKVMNQFEEAEHYYQVVGEKNHSIIFHNDKGRFSIGFTDTWIYHDGMFGITADTKTLQALEKRGLIKIHEIGGSVADVIEVIGKTPHKPLKRAVKINVNRKTKTSEHNLTEYMDANSTTAEEVQKRYVERFPSVEWKVIELGEVVELTRWDYTK
ncbi:hypothetical protein [Fictibacillus sp. NRS-1165]|uniref:hypothetical protein n=1 Tax=Fictibacillus sp. NRS-1165 TaxID=3144463 RepID=UPI003D1AA252